MIQKDALRTTLISYIGLVLGYVNKGVLFILFLTTDEIGLLSLLVSIGTLFAQFSNVGMAYTVWRFFPFFRNKERNNFGFFQFSILVTLAGIAVVTLFTLVFKDAICSLYIEKSRLFVQYYYWIIPIGVAYSLFLTLDNFLRSLYKNIVSAIAAELVLRLIVTASIVLYALGWIDFFQLLVIHSVSYIVPTLILVWQLVRHREFRWSTSEIAISRRFKKLIFSFSLYTYLNLIGLLVVLSLDTVMVASMIGLEATGIFSTIVYIASGLLIPYKSLVRISSPFVAQYWREKAMGKMKDMYVRTSSTGLVLGLFPFLLFWVSREEIFHFFPPVFAQGIPVFLILMIGRLVDIYCGINGTIFASSKKYRYDLIFTSVLLILVFLMNLWLIPKFGITGAALSTTIAFIAYNICRLLFIYFAYGIHPFVPRQLSVIGLALVVLTGCELVPELIANDLAWVIVKSAIVFTTFLVPVYLFKLDKDVADYLQKIMHTIGRRVFRREQKPISNG